MEALTTSLNKFGVNLYKDLSEANDQNIFFSPLSISSALSMVFLGARGDTEKQMAEVLNFKTSTGAQNPDAADIQVLEELSSQINQPNSKYNLKIANELYSQKSFCILVPYTDQLNKSFNAKVQSMDFSKDAENSRKEINSSVESQTEGKIKDILAPGSIDAQTRLVLVNAIYFKGNWEKKFPEENTEQKPFRMSKTQSKQVPMMFQRNTFNMFYIEELRTKVLEMPYVGNEVSTIILLPDAIEDNSTGLEQLEAVINYEKLSEWIEAMEKTKVEIEFPRIHLEENYDLKTPLIKMGMADLFNADKADLKGMSDTEKLYLSHILHKAFVEINEEGTEAAAATAGVITAKRSTKAVKFNADHPFIIMMKHNKSNTLLFMGKYVSP
ncbi:leukocyte elastase inhibitor-like [Pseudophryne corroboree]|uniref:leukocyte elastase inhibitor-like n=1 Tax=Pseudophryne corroboree TaxID=495146 RepID=UPI00308152E4